MTEIAQSILSGGMAYVKAERMRKIARILSDRFDGDPSGGLRKMAVDELYKFLTHLPGMGPKSALCVMMWSLKYDVFPVDVNVSRIAIRVGALKPGLKHYHYQQLLPVMIPDGRSRDLHVSLVVHGRAICLPRIPKCESCQIRDLCNFGSKKKRRSSRNKRMGPSLNADPNV